MNHKGLLAGKVVLLTGGASGIGKALATRFASGTTLVVDGGGLAGSGT